MFGVGSDDLEFTISAAVIGTHAIGCLQVGDSVVGIERNGKATELSFAPANGDYANETYFVSPREPERTALSTRLVPRSNVTGILAFSDGLAGCLIHHRTRALAPGVSQVLRKLGDGEWGQTQLEEFLGHPCWQANCDDDRGVAYLAMPAVLRLNNLGITAPVSHPASEI